MLDKLLRKLKRQPEGAAADRERDPRGGLQSPEYRNADPRDVVEEDGVVMSGPGGTPQDNGSGASS